MKSTIRTLENIIANVRALQKSLVFQYKPEDGRLLIPINNQLAGAEAMLQQALEHAKGLRR